jgi:hypothetical protein
VVLVLQLISHLWSDLQRGGKINITGNKYKMKLKKEITLELKIHDSEYCNVLLILFQASERKLFLSDAIRCGSIR